MASKNFNIIAKEVFSFLEKDFSFEFIDCVNDESGYTLSYKE